MQSNRNKPSTNNRRAFQKKRTLPKNSGPDSNDGCLSQKICKGKHTKIEPNETFRENAEKIFKNQEIRIVNTLDESLAVIGELRRHLEEYNVLGFDCEWLSQYRRYPVALLQLSSNRGLCALFRLCKLEKIPYELKQLLEDENVLKVGIQPHVDERYLINDYGIACVASTLDLRTLARECGLKSGGLGRLAEEHLQVLIDKNRCIVASDWEADELLEVQKEYAAKDALVSLELFKVFEEKLKPKLIDCDEKQHVQEFIEEYCKKHLNKKGNPNKKLAEKVDHFENQNVQYVKTVDDYLRAIEILKSHCDEYNVLGFKLLKTKSGSSTVYLLQLATHRRLSVIVPLYTDSVAIPSSLQELLQDKNILKVGVSPKRTLLNESPIRGTLDLNFLLRRMKKSEKGNRFVLSLPALSKWFLKVKLNKNPSFKLESVEKNLKTNDAHISIELFKEFVKRLEPGTDNDGENHVVDLKHFIEKHCLNYVDVDIKLYRNLAKSTEGGKTLVESKQPSKE